MRTLRHSGLPCLVLTLRLPGGGAEQGTHQLACSFFRYEMWPQSHSLQAHLQDGGYLILCPLYSPSAQDKMRESSFWVCFRYASSPSGTCSPLCPRSAEPPTCPRWGMTEPLWRTHLGFALLTGWTSCLCADGSVSVWAALASRAVGQQHGCAPPLCLQSPGEQQSSPPKKVPVFRGLERRGDGQCRAHSSTG